MGLRFQHKNEGRRVRGTHGKCVFPHMHIHTDTQTRTHTPMKKITKKIKLCLQRCLVSKVLIKQKDLDLVQQVRILAAIQRTLV